MAFVSKGPTFKFRFLELDSWFKWSWGFGTLYTTVIRNGFCYSLWKIIKGWKRCATLAHLFNNFSIQKEKISKIYDSSGLFDRPKTWFKSKTPTGNDLKRDVKKFRSLLIWWWRFALSWAWKWQIFYGRNSFFIIFWLWRICL